MSIATDYYEATGETVAQAVMDMHDRGLPIGRVAAIIGYRTSSDLRRYLAVRGVECPWPRTEKRGRGKPPIKITDAKMERFVELRKQGLPAKEAAATIGHPVRSIYNAIERRRPDLMHRGKYKGDKHKFV